MLDTKSTFDHLITQYAVTEEQAQSILDNRFYRNIAGALSGTQEYMAMEKLYELHDYRRLRPHRRRHAADPPRARLPRRAAAAHALPRQPHLPDADGADPVGVASHCGRDPGVPPHDRARGRTRCRRRRRRVLPARSKAWSRAFATAPPRCTRLLDADETAFVLVTTPRRDAVEEAQYFAERLLETGRSVEALVVNRVHPHFSRESPDEIRSTRRRRSRPVSPELATCFANLVDFEEVAARERRQLAGLQERIGHAAVTYVPELGHDVLEFAALHEVGRHLTGG